MQFLTTALEIDDIGACFYVQERCHVLFVKSADGQNGVCGGIADLRTDCSAGKKLNLNHCIHLLHFNFFYSFYDDHIIPRRDLLLSVYIFW